MERWGREESEHMRIQVFYHFNTTQQPETSVGVSVGRWGDRAEGRTGGEEREREIDREIRLIFREREIVQQR